MSLLFDGGGRVNPETVYRVETPPPNRIVTVARNDVNDRMTQVRENRDDSRVVRNS